MPEYATVLEEDSPLGVALFGLDRRLPRWVDTDWSKPVLDLGPGNKLIVSAKRLDWPNWDANAAFCLQSQYEDDSVGGIFAINLLEHLEDPRHLIRQMAAVLAPGCPATIFVPNANSNMYLQDLDHKTPFVIDSFKNFLEPHPYYQSKGHGALPLKVGAVFSFAVKDENLGVVAQLIKKTPEEL